MHTEVQSQSNVSTVACVRQFPISPGCGWNQFPFRLWSGHTNFHCSYTHVNNMAFCSSRVLATFWEKLLIFLALHTGWILELRFLNFWWLDWRLYFLFFFLLQLLGIVRRFFIPLNLITLRHFYTTQYYFIRLKPFAFSFAYILFYYKHVCFSRISISPVYTGSIISLPKIKNAPIEWKNNAWPFFYERPKIRIR